MQINNSSLTTPNKKPSFSMNDFINTHFFKTKPKPVET